MTGWQAENYAVAKFFGIDVDIVEYQWSYVDFLDRLEYMKWSQYISAKAQEIPD